MISWSVFILSVDFYISKTPRNMAQVIERLMFIDMLIVAQVIPLSKDTEHCNSTATSLKMQS